MTSKVVTKPRPRHVPQRTCVACRHTTAKRDLVRIVRTLQGRVEIDPTGKKSGRGAYLCKAQHCWQLALKKDRLDYALKTKLTPEEKESLLQYAHSFPSIGKGG
ncbi:MAG: RNase P modulator RnpM [Dehalococcoidia bacterium]